MRANQHDKDNSTAFLTTKTGQSALEYMMTYGWAILIIVIVAVILYSMGIFNPASSVSFTSSGFSPFTVSSSSCNSISYKVAVIAGPIPNNANSLQITKVYVTSASGANVSNSVYTLSSPITLKSGQSAVIIVPNVACNAANVKYSFSAIIQYTYSVPSIGTQTINTSGTVAGTSIAGKPSILTSYEPLTITNTQTSATPSPFQQMVNMTSTDPGWSSISTSNFAQNVEFFYYNGSVIPSWLESYTTSGAIWWLKLPSISNSMVIYMGFAPLTTSLFNNVNTGEAPQLSATYGQYDDGANVFNNYWNFAGTTIPNGWSISDSSGVVISNGLSITGGAAYTSSSVFTALNSIEEANVNYTSLNNGGYSGIMQANSQCPQGNNGGSNAEILWMTNSGNNILTAWSADGTYQGYNIQNAVSSGFMPPLNKYFIMGDSVSFSNISEYINYNTKLTISGTYNTQQFMILGSYGGVCAGTASVNPISIRWVRVRTYPPNGVMPLVSFGSIS